MRSLSTTLEFAAFYLYARNPIPKLKLISVILLIISDSEVTISQGGIYVHF